jgi:hypothetical protein
MRRCLPALLLSTACGGEPAPAKGDGASGAGTGGADAPTTEVIPETPDVPESVDVGGYAIKGLLLSDRSDTPVTDGLCVEAIDQQDLALGQEPTVLAGTTADGAGAFTLNALPVPSTAGLALRVRVCGGDTNTWYPTMTLLPSEAVAGLGPADTLDGQVAWVVPTADALDVEAGLLENGAPAGLDEAGAILGQIFDTDGAPLALAAIRGPDATRVHYDQGADIWLPYVNTTAEGEARYAAPGAPWALWTCRAQAYNIPPLLGGAVPGWITRWDFRASEDFSSGG